VASSILQVRSTGEDKIVTFGKLWVNSLEEATVGNFFKTVAYAFLQNNPFIT